MTSVEVLAYSPTPEATVVSSLASLGAPDPASLSAMDYDEASCEVPYSPDLRWYLVAVVGTLLSLVSLICNSMIAFVLLRRRYAHFYFLGLLAASDTFLSLCYAPVIAMDVIKNRLQYVWLARLYWHYVFPLLSLCHVSMTFSCLMIILGTIERYLITVHSNSAILRRWRQHRRSLALAMMGVSLALRGTEIFEYTFAENKQCEDTLTEYEPILTELVKDYLYGTVFRFYIRNILTVFVPFFLLAYLNLCIVRTLRRQHRSATMFKCGTSDHKFKMRSATRLLVFIVCSYLIANVLNVLITAWEYVDFESTQDYFEIYETLTDVISVLYVFTCASRLLVYLACNQELRCAFFDVLCTGSLFDRSGQLSPSTPTEKHKLSDPRSSVIVHRSALGTDFDRVAIAIAGTTPRPSTSSNHGNQVIEVFANHHAHLHPFALGNGNGGASNGYHTIENAMLIENPLAAIDDSDFENE